MFRFHSIMAGSLRKDGACRVQHSHSRHTSGASVVFFSVSYLFGTGVDVHAPAVFLGMQPFPLLEEDECRPGRGKQGEDGQPDDESGQAVACDESRDGRARASRRPIDVASLEAQKFKRPLQPLEYRVVLKTLFPVSHPIYRLGGDAEEQRQCLGGRNQENAGAYDHHDFLFQNLLPNCKVLNINTPKKQKVPKETNWKQKFQKPQNENICLIYLNTEMNGNFHFLSFCAAFLKVQNQVL